MKFGNPVLYLKIADFIFRLKFHRTQSNKTRNDFKARIFNYYKGFIIPHPRKKADFTIEFIEEYNYESFVRKSTDSHYINFYRVKAKNVIISFYHLSLKQLEYIFRYSAQKLLSVNNGFIIHASSVASNYKCLLFTGPSGVGKSTIIKLLKSKFRPLADDSVIIRKRGKSFYLYQTPVREKEWKIKKDFRRYPLSKFFFLKQASDNKIIKVEDKQALLKNMLSQFWTSDKTSGKKQMSIIFNFINQFKYFYQLSFRKEKGSLINLLTNNAA